MSGRQVRRGLSEELHDALCPGWSMKLQAVPGAPGAPPTRSRKSPCFFMCSTRPPSSRMRRIASSIGWNADGRTLGDVGYDALVEVDFELVAGVELRGVALDDRQAHIHGVPVEDPREGLCQDRAGAGELDDDRGVLARGAEAEIAPADDEIARLASWRRIGVGVLEDVLGQLREVRAQVVIAPGGDEVG